MKLDLLPDISSMMWSLKCERSSDVLAAPTRDLIRRELIRSNGCLSCISTKGKTHGQGGDHRRAEIGEGNSRTLPHGWISPGLGANQPIWRFVADVPSVVATTINAPKKKNNLSGDNETIVPY